MTNYYRTPHPSPPRARSRTYWWLTASYVAAIIGVVVLSGKTAEAIECPEQVIETDEEKLECPTPIPTATPSPEPTATPEPTQTPFPTPSPTVTPVVPTPTSTPKTVPSTTPSAGPTSTPVPSPKPPLEPQNPRPTPIIPEPPCLEDQPCWDCETMGNRLCELPNTGTSGLLAVIGFTFLAAGVTLVTVSRLKALDDTETGR